MRNLLLLLCLFSYQLGVTQTPIAVADSLSNLEEYEAANAIYKAKMSKALTESAYDDYLSYVIRYATNLQQTYEDEAAKNVLAEALEKVEKKSVQDTLLGKAYHLLGNCLYYLYEEKEAINYYQKSIGSKEKVYPDSHIEIIKSLRNIGNCYNFLDEIALAQQYFQRCLDLSLKNKVVPNEMLLDIYTDLGFCYAQLDDFNKAEEYLATALDLTQANFPDDVKRLITILDSRYFMYERQEAHEKMIETAKQSLTLAKAVSDKELQDELMIANSYNNLAIAYEAVDSLALAEQYYLNSLAINRRFSEDRSYELAQNYNNLTGVYWKRGMKKEAFDAIEKAITINRLGNDYLALSDNYHNKAMAFEEFKQYDEALSNYQTSIQTLVPSFQSKSVYDLPDVTNIPANLKPALTESLQEKADVFLKLHQQSKALEDLQAATTIYELISKLIDQIRLDFDSDESKSFLTKKAKGIFEKAIQANLELFETTKDQQYLVTAFDLVERSKALILLDAVKENQAKIKVGIPASIIERERSLKTEIQNLEQQLFEAAQDQEDSTQVIRADLIAVERALEKWIDSLETNYPEYHQLKYSTQLASVSDIQEKLLRPNQGMLQYFVGDAAIYAFFVPKEGTIAVQQIGIDFPLASWIDNLRLGIYGAFTNQLEQAKAEQQFAKYAHQLYQKLLAPIAQQQPFPQELIVIPDGLLGYIPFDALLTANVPGEAIGKYYQYPFFIKQHQIAYTYSATLLQAMQQATIQPKYQKVLAFAPSFGNNQSVSTDRSGLGALVHNRKEIQSIKRILGGKNLFDQEANKQSFLDLAAQYRYLHLSSHARMNDQYPDYSYIAFTQSQADSIDESELLYVNDLYNIPLNSDMVVLSACETGLGQLAKGEGIISLSRAFSYAGARSVITSLWRVSDQHTTNLMVDFYQHLKTGQAKDKALWQAKKQFVEAGLYAHPYYWAGFIPIGNMNPIEQNGTSLHYWWLGLLILPVLFFWWRRKG